MDMLTENGSKVHSIYDHGFGIPGKFKFLISSGMISYYSMITCAIWCALIVQVFTPKVNSEKRQETPSQ